VVTDHLLYEMRLNGADGIEVLVSVALPLAATWGGSGERVSSRDALPPIVQMAAADVLKNIYDAQNEVPF
jgi:hypothetical protein